MIEVYSNEYLKLSPSYLLNFIGRAKDFFMNRTLHLTGLVNELWSVNTTLEIR